MNKGRNKTKKKYYFANDNNRAASFTKEEKYKNFSLTLKTTGKLKN